MNIRELYSYDPETGLFRHLNSRFPKFNGQIAGNLNQRGYWVISIKRKTYLAHRLAWLYMTGEWPTMIDHIDGNCSNNRFDNLRVVNAYQSNANRGLSKNNRYGCKGIKPNANKWVVEIMKNHKNIFIGSFGTKDQAIAAWHKAASEHFGEYKRQ